MIALKGAEVSAKLKEQVAALKKGVKGETPCLAIVRVGENPDDMSYERGAMKKMEAFGLKAQSFAFPADITDGDFKREFARINGDPAVGLFPNGQAGHHSAQRCAHRAAQGRGASAAGNRAL